MRISQINNVNTFKVNNNNKTSLTSQNNYKSAGIMPNYAHYISFCGGSSLNLKESVKNLDTISSFPGEKFPQDIHQAALEVVESGNPDNKTLIDIHKEKYSFLNSCYNLKDVKEYFPEFSDVLSDSEVDYHNNSFIDIVKKGGSKNFNKDEDLAFQLLKLYWAEGFSLTDLKRENGLDLYHTLKKFNIPLMDKDYAHVLKFSDKEYNERLTNKMAQSRMEARDRVEMKENGEPVYIPRKPLSDIHKKHISEGLIKYYSENPEKLSAMSERQKEYYIQNPEQAELMSQAMEFAWKTPEGRSVQTRLKKFFKKEGLKVDENQLIDFNLVANSQCEAMKKFWRINGWAKDHFSVAVKKGWAKAKELKSCAKSCEENATAARLIQARCVGFPPAYLVQLREWALKKGIDVSKIDFKKIKSFEPDFENMHRFAAINDRFKMAHDGISDCLASALQGALLKINISFRKNPTPEMLKHKEFYVAATNIIREYMYENVSPSNPYGGSAKILQEEDILTVMGALLLMAEEANYPEFPKTLSNYCNDMYKIIAQSNSGERADKTRNYLLN